MRATIEKLDDAINHSRRDTTATRVLALPPTLHFHKKKASAVTETPKPCQKHQT